MIRPVLAVLVASTLAAVTGGGVVRAEPAAPCSFMLSPPEVVQVSGTTMVTATVEPVACGNPANPYMSVACLQADNSGTECSQAHGGDTAQVYAAYKPGATYVATGRGLGSWNGQWYPEQDWQFLGPFTATL